MHKPDLILNRGLTFVEIICLHTIWTPRFYFTLLKIKCKSGYNDKYIFISTKSINSHLLIIPHRVIFSIYIFLHFLLNKLHVLTVKIVILYLNSIQVYYMFRFSFVGLSQPKYLYIVELNSIHSITVL